MASKWNGLLCIDCVRLQWLLRMALPIHRALFEFSKAIILSLIYLWARNRKKHTHTKSQVSNRSISLACIFYGSIFYLNASQSIASAREHFSRWKQKQNDKKHEFWYWTWRSMQSVCKQGSCSHVNAMPKRTTKKTADKRKIIAWRWWWGCNLMRFERDVRTK